MTLAIVLAAVGAVLVAYLLYLYNRLVRLRNEVDTGWSNIDVTLKRRTDLIPNLVEAVKGYAAHEREVLQNVTEARAALQAAQTPIAAAAADDLLGLALDRLFAVAEAYPDLKASENFLHLQEELVDTENKIAAARRYYNQTVMVSNNAVQTFPALLFAGALGFRAREFFEASEEDRQAIQVTFDRTTA
ncbi:MAG: LemA family protein [Actinobacteria bacterium]|nr:LemA family protein [Actinomycetota bacterium]